jgi:photosystem II stability/assembly factor-like uncharacterized protein
MRQYFALLPFMLWATCNFVNAQSTTKELFSRPGLNIGSYHDNFFDGKYNSSLRYIGDTAFCGVDLLGFDYIFSSGIKVSQTLRIEGTKIWLYNPAGCSDVYLLYDFGLMVGDTFTLYNSQKIKVIAIDSVSLQTGEKRKRLRMASIPSSTISFRWVEGIGDEGRGLIYDLYDFEGFDVFVCAKDDTGQLLNGTSTNTFLPCDSLLCPPPLAQFDFWVNDSSAIFTNTSQDAITFAWDFGDGTTSTEAQPTHTYSAPGCYRVTLTATNGCTHSPVPLAKSLPVCIDPKWQPFGMPSASGHWKAQFLDNLNGWAFSGDQLFETHNGGNNWNALPFPLPPPPKTRPIISFHTLDGQKAIVTCGHYNGNGSEKAILTTDDGGQTWTEHIDGSYWQSNGLLTPDGKAFTLGDYGEMNFSPDGGTTWQARQLPLGKTLYDIQYLGNARLHAMGWHGLQPNVEYFFARTFNDGLTWEFLPTNPENKITKDFHFVSTDEGWATATSGGLWHTTNAGDTWDWIDVGEPETLSDIDFPDAQNGWAVGKNGLVLHTTDGGATWQRENCGNAQDLRSVSAPSPEFAFATGGWGHGQRFAPQPDFDCIVGTNEQHNNRASLQITPNPATDQATIHCTYKNTHKVLLINILGEIQREIYLQNGSATVSLDGLPAGLYWVRMGNGAAGKLVVTN